MTFGDAETESARTHSVEDISAILDTFQSHGHKEASRREHLIYCPNRVDINRLILQGRTQMGPQSDCLET